MNDKNSRKATPFWKKISHKSSRECQNILDMITQFLFIDSRKV